MLSAMAELWTRQKVHIGQDAPTASDAINVSDGDKEEIVGRGFPAVVRDGIVSAACFLAFDAC